MAHQEWEVVITSETDEDPKSMFVLYDVQASIPDLIHKLDSLNHIVVAPYNAKSAIPMGYSNRILFYPCAPNSRRFCSESFREHSHTIRTHIMHHTGSTKLNGMIAINIPLAQDQSYVARLLKHWRWIGWDNMATFSATIEVILIAGMNGWEQACDSYQVKIEEAGFYAHRWANGINMFENSFDAISLTQASERRFRACQRILNTYAQDIAYLAGRAAHFGGMTRVKFRDMFRGQDRIFLAFRFA